MTYVYSVESQIQECVPQDCSARFSAEPTIPERFADPVTKLRLVFAFDLHKANCTDQMATVSVGDREGESFSRVVIFLVSSDPLLRHSVFIRMRNILGGVGYRKVAR